jgi:energy-coupling factor transport system substrate-specific component
LSYIADGAIGENLSRFITFHFATAMAWDIPRAVFTTILLALSGKAVLSALRRTKTRAAFLQPIEFNERAKA